MRESLKRIGALAWLVLLDGIRRHAILGLIALSVAAQAGGLFFFDFIPREIGRASNDFILSVAWLSGFIFLFFHGVQAIALDEEKKVIYALLARPLSRGQYVLGVFCGLAILLLFLNLLLCGLGAGTLLIIRNLVQPAYFDTFNVSYYLLSWAGIMAIELMLLAVIMFFSGLIRGSFPVLLISLAFYAICTGLPVVREVVRQRDDLYLPAAGMNKLLLGLTLIFPDFERLDFKNLITTPNPTLDLSLIVINFGLAAAYVALLLWLACLVYHRRDLQ